MMCKVGCANIESISVPATISRIEEKAFYGSGLTTFIAEKGSELSYVAKNSFCSKTSHFYFGGSLEQWCSIVFEDKSSTPIYLDPHFYMLNENDEWVEVIDLVIPNAGFSACFALKNINIPDGTTRIGNRAFEDCTSLTSIFIPKTVTEIDINAFKNCENLTIYCESSGPMGGWDETWNSSNCKVVWNS
jgi:hypothetical protein